MAATGINLHISPTSIMFASRIERVTEYLQRKAYFSRVEIVGIRDATIPETERRADGRVVRRFAVREGLRSSSRIGRALDFLIWYADILLHYKSTQIACVNVHTASALPLGWLISFVHRCVLVYEPHELESETMNAGNVAKAIIRTVERIFSRRAVAVIAVHEGIAEWYAENLGVRHPWSVRNLPASSQYEPLPPCYFAKRFGFADDDLVFLYQGLIAKGRGIQLLIDAFKLVDSNRHLVILGFGDLKDIVDQAASEHPNIHFHPAVPPEELLRHTAAADVGMLMIEPISLSYKYCYPNKYCECLTAHVPVIFTDSLWLRREVEGFDCGWPSPPDSVVLAQLVRSLDRKAISLARAGAAAWATSNSWKSEELVLDQIYKFASGQDDATAARAAMPNVSDPIGKLAKRLHK
jgi:glycosyltransferase involved in cell wall biosynthesis